MDSAASSALDHIESASTSTEGDEERDTNSAPVGERKSGPFGGLSASEAASRKHEKARERKTARNQAAELDALAVSGRVSTALAAKLTYAEIEAVIATLSEKAKEGSIQAIRELRSWLALAGVDGGAGDGDATPWEEMSAEQRSAARAQLASELRVLEGVTEEAPAQAPNP